MKQYQPLYLKYRPQKLSELVGQEVVTKTLSNAISYNKIVHAYLFCGPRGTGKTSTARILAKSLNCESGITVEPCGKCLSCQGITNGNSLDVIEIDAASHRKVEDAEDLINRVSLGTYGSRFKIYIIDEVHMLTDHAFNALLKTLEEPPKNVIFILATTEEYKVIPTIISRCQKLDFKPVPKEQLEKRIRDISKEEKINIDETIINFISNRSSGCLRDAVSLLDQISVLQVDDKQISPNEVFELFGTVNRTGLFKLLESILKFDRKKSIDLAEDLIKSGKDISELFKDLLELVIDLAKANIASDYRSKLSRELSVDLSVLDNITHGHLLKIIDRLHDSQSKLRFALSQELQFMADVMNMLDEDFIVSLKELKVRIEKLESGETQNIKQEPKKQISKDLENIKQEVENVKHEKEQKNVTLNNNEESHNVNAGVLHSDSESELDVLWQRAVSLIESNPTKTLLRQSESYLLQLSDDIVEVGLSKDTFLPRLDQDVKKKEMILKALELASGTIPKAIRFKVVPRKTKPILAVINDEQLEGNPELQMESNGLPQTASQKLQASGYKSGSSDDFTNAMTELLGAKQVE